jgi:hypothetical protein
VGIAGGRSQQGGIARGQYVQCGGAGRGLVALTGSRHWRCPRSSFDAWSRSRAVLKFLHSFQSLQAIPDEKCHLWVGVRKF